MDSSVHREFNLRVIFSFLSDFAFLTILFSTIKDKNAPFSQSDYFFMNESRRLFKGQNRSLKYLLKTFVEMNLFHVSLIKLYVDFDKSITLRLESN